MVFSEFVQMLHGYVTSEIGQQEAVRELFLLFMSDPETEKDREKHAKGEYYPYAKKTMKSSARKVYAGTQGRTIPAKTAAHVLSHFSSVKFLDQMCMFEDEAMEELCKKVAGYGYPCTKYNVAEKCAEIFKEILHECEKKTATGKEKESARVSMDTEYADLPLLSEVNNECPICHAPLVKTIRGVSKPKYGIVKIFPSDLSAEDQAAFEAISKPPKDLELNDNKIALCLDHAEEYEMEPDTEEFKKMLALKKKYSDSYKLRMRIASQDLEEEIQDVIFALTDLPSTIEFAELPLSALKVAEKIPDKCGVLQSDVEKDALKYYNFIRNQFSIAGNFNLIASEIKKTYELLAKDPNRTKEDIFVGLMNWILSSRHLESRHLLSARLVVSFFVQNCEVFEKDEISG